MMVYEDECRAAGLDPAEVRRIALRLERAAIDARRLGLTVFGGTGSGDLRFHTTDALGSLICAHMDGRWDGGDGGCDTGGDGLLRGETAR